MLTHNGTRIWLCADRDGKAKAELINGQISDVCHGHCKKESKQYLTLQAHYKHTEHAHMHAPTQTVLHKAKTHSICQLQLLIAI